VKPREIKRTQFGGMEIVDYYDKGFNKLVMLPLKSYLRDYAQQAEFVKQAGEAV
jgi:hypothetical protein